MTWVKVCGITSAEALDAALEAGADAIGLVMHPGSPRALDVDAAASFADQATVPTFIVSVDLDPDSAVALATRVGADGIQNHGAHATDVANRAIADGFLALRPVPVGTGVPVRPASLHPDVMPLYDTGHAVMHGGTGMTFDWSVLTGVEGPFVVAGGLGPDNVADLIATVGPFGVDASSRLEVAPGVKDPDTIRAFVREARRP